MESSSCECGCGRLVEQPALGRTRRFALDACRQAAHRLRAATAAPAGVALDPRAEVIRQRLADQLARELGDRRRRARWEADWSGGLKVDRGGNRSRGQQEAARSTAAMEARAEEELRIRADLAAQLQPTVTKVPGGRDPGLELAPELEERFAVDLVPRLPTAAQAAAPLDRVLRRIRRLRDRLGEVDYRAWLEVYSHEDPEENRPCPRCTIGQVAKLGRGWSCTNCHWPKPCD